MAIKVFKFGGASVKDAAHIYNVGDIIVHHHDKILVIVSAMGKTTNALEKIWEAYTKNGIEAFKDMITDIIEFHLQEAKKLKVSEDKLRKEYDILVQEVINCLSSNEPITKEVSYDQIVALGELMSSKLLAKYIAKKKPATAWQDIREVIVTDSRHQEATVDFEKTTINVEKSIRNLFKSNDIIITQGFIGRTPEGMTTTLGREGSDYTGAILAFCLDVNELTIWKDVPGVLTADPRRFENVEKIDKMSYKEAIEMTYYGAQVIHPKTIRPLQNKGILLRVKSYIDPEGEGTVIAQDGLLNYPPLVVIQDDMILLQISSKDFSFIAEHHLSQIFATLNENRIKLCTMQNSAISFTICVKNPGHQKLDKLIANLGHNFSIEVFNNLQLITVRYFNKQLVENLTKNKVVLFEERMKYTIQLVVRPSLELIEK